MAKKEEKKSIIEICPIRNIVARFGNKWALLVILILSENENLRFNQLGKMIPDISSKVQHTAKSGSRQSGETNSVSRSTHSCGIHTDEYRAIAGSHHPIADGLGTIKHAVDYETSKDVRATSTMTLPTTVSGIRFYLNIGLQIEFVLNRGGGTKARSSYFIRKEKYGQTAPESHSYNSL